MQFTQEVAWTAFDFVVAGAFVQALVAIIARMTDAAEGFVASGVFAAGWSLAAWLFGRAARGEVVTA